MTWRDWRFAWAVSGALVALYAFTWGDGFLRWQTEHPWWAQVIVLLNLQGFIAVAILAFIDERNKRRGERCED